MGIKDVVNEPRFNAGVRLRTLRRTGNARHRGQVIRTKPYAEWASIFDEADVPFAQARLPRKAWMTPRWRPTAWSSSCRTPRWVPSSRWGCLSNSRQRLAGSRPDESCQAHSQVVCLTIPRHPTASSQPAKRTFDPPLKGIRVLEITNLIAGPTAGRLLADLGADVIKFEPLDGDMSRPIGRTYFFNLNAHKRSMSVNTRTPEGKEVAQKVAATADVLLANMRPVPPSAWALDQRS